MKLTLERFVSDKDTTLGMFRIDGRFECFNVEDEHREDKIPGETRIPAGKYPIDLKTVGGFHSRYDREYRGMHHGMLRICNVPGFTDILFHRGNRERDTAGCMLPNTGVYARRDEMCGQASDSAYRRLYSKVVDAAASGDLTIEIIDRDLP